MTIRRASVLGSMASSLAVAAIWTACGSPASAFAADTLLEQFQVTTIFDSVMLAAKDKRSGPIYIPSADRIAYDMVINARPRTRADPPHSIAKALANYGELVSIPGTEGSDDCFGSGGIALAPSGKFAFMSGGIGSPGRLCGFVIDPVTQAWTPVTPAGAKPAAVGTVPRAVAFEPSGRFVYVAGNVNGTVSGFSINAVTGEPTPTPGSPFQTNGQLPIPMVIDRSGRFSYVGQSVGSFDGSISAASPRWRFRRTVASCLPAEARSRRIR